MITKYNKFNEGIKHLLVGPTIAEVCETFKDNPRMLYEKSMEYGYGKGIVDALNMGVKTGFVHVIEDIIKKLYYNEHYDAIIYVISKMNDKINFKLIPRPCLTYLFKINREIVISNFLENIEPDELLSISCDIGYLDGIKKAEKLGSDIHYISEHPLRNACEKGQLDIAKYLISKGANIHIKEEYCLRNAILYGHLDIVKLLLENGAILNRRSLEFRRSYDEIDDFLKKYMKK